MIWRGLIKGPGSEAIEVSYILTNVDLIAPQILKKCFMSYKKFTVLATW